VGGLLSYLAFYSVYCEKGWAVLAIPTIRSSRAAALGIDCGSLGFVINRGHPFITLERLHRLALGFVASLSFSLSTIFLLVRLPALDPFSVQYLRTRLRAPEGSHKQISSPRVN